MSHTDIGIATRKPGARPINIACPIERDESRLTVAMKRRMRPIADTLDQAMFHGIDVAIFDMARVIGFIADQVLPRSAVARRRVRRARCERR
jgi:hypothetical protein